jgi:hypothetical protein
MRKVRATGRPLRDKLIAAVICIDCQIAPAAETVRCALCAETHRQAQRKRYAAKPVSRELRAKRKRRAELRQWLAERGVK